MSPLTYCANKKRVRCQDPVLIIVQTYLLFPPLLPLVLCVLQHLLSPQVEEVGWIGVELQTLLPVVPADRENKPRNLVTFWLASQRSSFLPVLLKMTRAAMISLSMYYSI